MTLLGVCLDVLNRPDYCNVNTIVLSFPLVLALVSMEVLTIVSSVLYSSLVLVVSLYCWYRWRYRDILRVASKLPCTSRALPLIGDLHAGLWGLECK